MNDIYYIENKDFQNYFQQDIVEVSFKISLLFLIPLPQKSKCNIKELRLIADPRSTCIQMCSSLMYHPST